MLYRSYRGVLWSETSDNIQLIHHHPAAGPSLVRTSEVTSVVSSEYHLIITLLYTICRPTDLKTEVLQLSAVIFRPILFPWRLRKCHFWRSFLNELAIPCVQLTLCTAFTCRKYLNVSICHSALYPRGLQLLCPRGMVSRTRPSEQSLVLIATSLSAKGCSEICVSWTSV